MPEGGAEGMILTSGRRFPGYGFASTSPEMLVEVLDPGTLPPDWSSSPPPLAVQAIGDAWVASGRSAVLAVPCTIVPGAVNYLLNPAHATFAELVVGVPEPFVFDRRLIAP